MPDVNMANVSEAAEPQGEVETPQQASQPEKQTVQETAEPTVDVAAAKEAQAPQERTVPYTRFAEINKKYREIERRFNEAQRQQALSGYDPNDWEQITQHPFVQELMVKDAERELGDYAREILDEYQNVHPQVKKAILKNVRGFAKTSTTDVETAKLDLLEYIESIVEGEQTPATPVKSFQVAQTNVAATEPSKARPAQISEIMQKPVDEMTDDEVKLVSDYKKSLPRK